jgi:hypothetical protein
MNTSNEEFLARLRRNDPSETDVDITLRYFSDDIHSISEALQANDHVNMIEFDFTDLHSRYFIDNIDWELLLRVIAIRENLEQVHLIDAFGVSFRNPSDRIVPFLLAIQQNGRVQTVSFEFLQLSGDSMASFLDTATSVTELNLYVCRVQGPADALAIAAALQRNKNIQRLELRSLDEMLLIPLLNSLASEQSNLQSLSLTNCSVRESFRAAISGILHPHSLLRHLELDFLPGFEAAEDFSPLFAAVETSPLESFKIKTLRSFESWALIASIPKMQLRTLEVGVGLDLDPDLWYMKRDLIGAVKGNATLRTVVARADDSDDWLDNDDRMKLISYSTRNEFLAQWSDNPAVVSDAAWLEALLVARTTGPGTVFHILRTLAPFLWTSEE